MVGKNTAKISKARRRVTAQLQNESYRFLEDFAASNGYSIAGAMNALLLKMALGKATEVTALIDEYQERRQPFVTAARNF